MLALNECWAPHVGALDRGRLEAILDHAEVALAAEQGFVEVGRQWTCGDTVEVQLMVRPL